MESKLKRKDSHAPYHKCNDWRFKVRNSVLKGFCLIMVIVDYQWLNLGYLDEWELEIKMMKELSSAQRKKLCLSVKTLDRVYASLVYIGSYIIKKYCNIYSRLQIYTVNSFCTLAPIL